MRGRPVLLVSVLLQLAGANGARSEGDEDRLAQFARRWSAAAEDMRSAQTTIAYTAQILPAGHMDSAALRQRFERLCSQADGLLRAGEDDSLVDHLESDLRAALFHPPQVEEVRTANGVSYVGFPSVLGQGKVEVHCHPTGRVVERHEKILAKTGQTWLFSVAADREFACEYTNALDAVQISLPGQSGTSYEAPKLLAPLPFGSALASQLSANYRSVPGGLVQRTTGKVIRLSGAGLPSMWGYGTLTGTSNDLRWPGDENFNSVRVAAMALWPCGKIYPVLVASVSAVGDGKTFFVSVSRVRSVERPSNDSLPRLRVPASAAIVDHSVSPFQSYDARHPELWPSRWSSLLDVAPARFQLPQRLPDRVEADRPGQGSFVDGSGDDESHRTVWLTALGAFGLALGVAAWRRSRRQGSR